VLRAIEVIGEAVKHMPLDFRMKFPKAPTIEGFLDELAHKYGLKILSFSPAASIFLA
jgi:uncharacterized protein with HEPN domain